METPEQTPAGQEFFAIMDAMKEKVADRFELLLPPPCFIAHGGHITEFKAGEFMVVEFPIRRAQLNPLGNLQGGIMGAFIDDTMGPLTFATVRKPTVSLDLSVNFIRGASENERVRVRAEVKSRGRRALSLYAEAFNQRDKLMATATSNVLVL